MHSIYVSNQSCVQKTLGNENRSNYILQFVFLFLIIVKSLNQEINIVSIHNNDQIIQNKINDHIKNHNAIYS